MTHATAVRACQRSVAALLCAAACSASPPRSPAPRQASARSRGPGGCLHEPGHGDAPAECASAHGSSTRPRSPSRPTARTSTSSAASPRADRRKLRHDRDPQARPRHGRTRSEAAASAPTEPTATAGRAADARVELGAARRRRRHREPRRAHGVRHRERLGERPRVLARPLHGRADAPRAASRAPRVPAPRAARRTSSKAPTNCSPAPTARRCTSPRPSRGPSRPSSHRRARRRRARAGAGRGRRTPASGSSPAPQARRSRRCSARPLRRFTRNPCIAVNGFDGSCAVGTAMQGVGALTLSPDGKDLYAVAEGSHAIDEITPTAAEPLAETRLPDARRPRRRLRRRDDARSARRSSR